MNWSELPKNKNITEGGRTENRVGGGGEGVVVGRIWWSWGGQDGRWRGRDGDGCGEVGMGVVVGRTGWV